MARFFNTAGPIKADLHYQLNPLTRLDWEEIQLLISQQSYFVLHAPRQTGKTTTMLAMMKEINLQDSYVALYANIEVAQATRDNLDASIDAICASIAHHAQIHLQTNTFTLWLENQGKSVPAGDRLTQMLSHWCQQLAKPCILFIDEIDALIGDTLVSVLRQIRSGYAMRPNAFPQSIVLCGVRDVRDYRIHTKGEIITGGSAFNIKSESLRMGNFTLDEIKALYQQHTDATGQVFEQSIYNELWQDTQGQPWLVNALAYQVCWKAKENRDRNRTITLEAYKAAREVLIYARTTHLDQLSDKLKEPRVHAVIAPMLATHDALPETHTSIDNLQYVEDLGLIKLKPQLAISNRIYQEVIPRELIYPTATNISHQQSWYVDENNKLDSDKLLKAFQQFFRENIDTWSQSFDYKEAGPQLIMQAFLQRIINGGGRISREYALGRKRTDLLIEWPTSEQGFLGDVQRIVIELKILYGQLDSTIEKGLSQTAQYADSVGAEQAHLVIFNRDGDVVWQDKIWQKQCSFGQRDIVVWGC